MILSVQKMNLNSKVKIQIQITLLSGKDHLCISIFAGQKARAAGT
jgi:hypothetical protein